MITSRFYLEEKKMFNPLIIALISIGFLADLPSYAGMKTPSPVSINVYSDGSWMASGSLWDARASADTKQYIGCSLTLDQNAFPGYTINCTAINATGLAKSCMSTRSVYIPVVQSVNEFSYLFIQGTPNGECLMISVSNFSNYRPIEK